VIASIDDRILGLHGWAALAVVFLLPALESSAFVGFVFPGEIAVLLGGVLAYQHKVSLPAVLVAAVAGAIVGDSVGYEVGKRWGRRMLHGTIGRVVRHEHLDRAEHYLADRGGRAVFLGRFTAALRVLIPGVAGMSRMRYRTFVLYNAAGGALWAVGFVLAGYLAGTSWRQVEHIAGRASLVLLLLAAIAIAIGLSVRWLGNNRTQLREVLERQLDRPLVVRQRGRFDRQLNFLGRRLRPGQTGGLSLTLSLGLLALAGWIFGALVQDVITGDEAARLDRPVLNWFVAHREPWLTTTLKIVAGLGSSAIAVPVALTIGIVLSRRRRSLRPIPYLATTYLGAEVLFQAVKRLTHRSRPPLHLAVSHFGGYAFPSGHTTLATAVWGALAITIGATATTGTRKATIYTTAAMIAVAVGITRLYLGAHWLTDVLGGWALGAAWLIATSVAFRAWDAEQPRAPSNHAPT
jgi:membrane protein DedA with SNARE-associated domain/membrane-associated phospholipid phosphatase